MEWARWPTWVIETPPEVKASDQANKRASLLTRRVGHGAQRRRAGPRRASRRKERLGASGLARTLCPAVPRRRRSGARAGAAL